MTSRNSYGAHLLLVCGSLFSRSGVSCAEVVGICLLYSVDDACRRHVVRESQVLRSRSTVR